jgi:phosphatidylglycerophosphate synthase
MRSTSLAMVAALTRRPELVIEPPLSTDRKLFSFILFILIILINHLLLCLGIYHVTSAGMYLFVDDIVVTVLTGHVQALWPQSCCRRGTALLVRSKNLRKRERQKEKM